MRHNRFMVGMTIADSHKQIRATGFGPTKEAALQNAIDEAYDTIQGEYAMRVRMQTGQVTHLHWIARITDLANNAQTSERGNDATIATAIREAYEWEKQYEPWL